MNDTVFYASFATVYAAMALEAWRLKHRRLACCYGLAACLSLGFAAVHLPWPADGSVAVWV